MATKRVIVVFVLPVIFSIIFGSAVMADILQKPDRELHMIPNLSSGGSHGSSHDPIKILGLESQYSTSQPVEIQVKISDSSFDCGDLYVTIFSSTDDVVTQGGFFKQCFDGKSGILPIDDEFSKTIENPGSYKIVAEMVSKELTSVAVDEVFTVK